ncbi:hypothetical protein DQK91_17615 [Oceanidesulfovibrio marinus]|uniref:Uncharacterized protein n=1 Tax=Oceanidesulfovibrio marinus TaxID=370038 RepID=A0A6P1ZE14_9BACT|nr:hypothetical protein DQK91_17615 [Oceanidesulfovibrio marinus]
MLSGNTILQEIVRSQLSRRPRPAAWIVPLAALVCLLAAGCAATRYMSNQVVGNYYLNEHRYADGVAHFQEELAAHPQEPLPNYYMGRLLLAQSKPQEALPYLQKATALDPGEEEYWYWLGVNQWALGNPGAEQEAYLRALEIDPKYVPARLYYAHNLKDAGKLKDALTQYDKVLLEAPLQPDALYNRADILQKIGMRGLAAPAWKKYLDNYPDGSDAREAAMALNSQGDFTYRIHAIGVRQVVLHRIGFAPGSGSKLDKESLQSIHVVGAMLQDDPSLRVEIASYDKSGKDAATYRALAVRSALEQRGARPGQVSIAPYGRAERIRAGGRVHTLDDSIVFRNPRP